MGPQLSQDVGTLNTSAYWAGGVQGGRGCWPPQAAGKPTKRPYYPGQGSLLASPLGCLGPNPENQALWMGRMILAGLSKQMKHQPKKVPPTLREG